MSGRDGQATVELVALLPLIVVVSLAAATVIAARAAGEEAGQGAEAAAVALIGGRDPVRAAHAALPDAAGRRAAVTVHGRRVTVTVRPRLPLLADRLAGTATVDAGPEPPR